MDEAEAKARSDAFLERLLQEGIKAKKDEIAQVWDKGDVAVLFYNVDRTDELAVRSATSGGWTGERVEVHRLKRKRAVAFADNLPPGDPAARWLRLRGFGRILVWNGTGSLCVNFDPAKGYSIAPGTLDHEWMV